MMFSISWRRTILGLAILALVFTSLGPLLAQSKSPETEPIQVIESYSDRTVKLLQPESIEKDQLGQLRSKLFDTLAPIINFQLMTQSALGPHSRNLSNRQIEEFTQIFKPLVVNLYLDRLFAYMVHMDDPWTLKTVSVESQEYRLGKKYALVRSFAEVHRHDQERKLSMNFKMINQDGKWEVYDLVFEGVSLVENYRSQFSEILANGSFEQLKQKLKSQLKKVNQSDTSVVD